MQTKKRAKPVKFGKSAVSKAEKKEVLPVIEPQETSEVEIDEEITVHKSSHIKTPQHAPLEPEKVIVAETEEVVEDIPEEKVQPQEEESTDDVEEVSEDELVDSSNSETRKVLEEAESVLASASDAPAKADEDMEEPEAQRPQSRMAQTNDSPFDDVPLVEEKKRNPFLYFLVIAFGTFFVGLAFIVGANFLFESKTFSLSDFQSMMSMEKPTPTAEPTKKPTPTPHVDLSAYTVKVLNGSGITGEAAKLKDKLTADGFKVGTTGNADASDYDKTQITVKKEVSEAYVTKLKESLEKEYQVAEPVRLSDNASQEADVSVTIGKDTAN